MENHYISAKTSLDRVPRTGLLSARYDTVKEPYVMMHIAAAFFQFDR